MIRQKTTRTTSPKKRNSNAMRSGCGHSRPASPACITQEPHPSKRARRMGERPHKNLTPRRFLIHHADILPNPAVIGEIPAAVIGIVVDDELETPSLRSG